MLLVFLAIAAIGVSNDDYPREAIKQARDGIVGVEYEVDPSGKASTCRVMFTSGWPDLDEATCSGVLKHGRFQPGLGDGDRRRLRYRWALPPGVTGSHFPPLPNFGEIFVASMPKDAVRPFTNATFRVGADGKTAECRVKEGDGSGSTVLDKAACDTVRTAVFPIVPDRSGKAVSYDRVMTFQFKTQ